MRMLENVKWIKSKESIKRNLFVISFAWLLLFTAFQCMANLQSSLNSDEGLGTASLSVIYVSLVASSFFLPHMLIDYFGLKYTIILSQFTYLAFIAANIVPKWITLIPAAVAVGMGAGPLWTAKCVYLTECSNFYAQIEPVESSEIVMNRFFGIFFSLFQMSQIIGNLISSSVLKPAHQKEVAYSSTESSLKNIEKCGYHDCPSNYVLNSSKSASGTIIVRPETSSVNLLITINVILPLLSILLIYSQLNTYAREKYEQIKEDDYESNKSTRTRTTSNSLALLISTLKQLRNRNQLLLIPLTLWLGFSLAFMGADFTKSFVACSRGVESVGLSMICFGISNTIGSYFFGKLVKYTGRFFVFMTAGFLNYLGIIMMMSHKLEQSDQYFYYVIPFIWGAADSAWQTQIHSIYGVLFKESQEAAFSNFRLWESVGFAISYAYSNYICISTKLNLLLIYLTLGLMGYMLIELGNEKTSSLITQFYAILNANRQNSFLFLAVISVLLVLIYLNPFS